MNTKILWPVGCAGALVMGWFAGFIMGGTPVVGDGTPPQSIAETSAPSASKITRAAQQEPSAANGGDARAQMQTMLGALHDTNYLRRTRDLYDAILKISPAELSSTLTSQKIASASASGSTFGAFICNSSGVTGRQPLS